LVDSTIVGALLLALYERGRFVFAGRVGTGFSGRDRTELARALDGDRSKTPTVEGVPRQVATKDIWVTPRLVAEMAYLNRSPGELGHALYKGIR